ncbi:MAG: hypothetical protein GXP26_15525 [Planctomycetes bacterium]|nr:hypothetical protein [Planctomycetota bacterium]
MSTKLLISVRSPDEVEAAVAGGADWIDLKEPMAGPLGPVSADVARQVINCVGGRLPISAALGELRQWDDSSSRELLNFSAIHVVKLGLAGATRLGNWQATWRAAAETVSESGHELVAVAYADWQRAESPSPAEVIACANAVRSHYFLIDTFDKKSGSLFTHLTILELNEILCLAREASLTTVIAGSLGLADLSSLSLAKADVIGVRGSVCGGDRNAKVNLQRVADFRAALP